MDVATPRWDYAEVETALAAVFMVGEGNRGGWFRGRLINFRRLGLAPPSRRGAVIPYDFEWISLWFFALLLNVRLRVDPKTVVEFIQKNRETLCVLIGEARQAKRHQDHVVIEFHFGDTGPSSIGSVRMSELSKAGYGLAGDDPMSLGRLVTIYDLSNGLKALAANLVRVRHERSSASSEEAGRKSVPKRPRWKTHSAG
jgi:hypothetical protein